ncbi:MAG TPA: penicillin-binding protein 2 [Prolixibacteraceae bacterium]|nr:penicillin-binding protein 2 [Prolixibacteraceae bacterium]HRV89613.1 penicillin-binding protein 2 [Prolixibacteraceae bacterium]
MAAFSDRKTLITGIFVVVGIIFLLRLFQLQVADSTYKRFADNNALRKVVQYPARGLIYDRNHELLVYNKAAYDLLVIPRETGRFDTLAFAAMLDVPADLFTAELKKASAYSRYKPSVIVKQISHEKYASIQEQLYKMKGFYIQSRTLREYPRRIAAHALGYVGEVTQAMIDSNAYYQSGDYIGISGIEAAYEEELRGEKGVKYYMVDVHNRIQGSYLEGEMDTIARIGRNLTTTIDYRLQEYAEKLMQNKRGSVVAIEPSTGEVLALVNAPSYDPNLLVGRARGRNYSLLLSDPVKPLFNRALMAQYPPGSTFKMAQALVALEEGAITPQTRFHCAGGYSSGSFRVACHHNQSFEVVESIARSCNAYYVYAFRAILENPRYASIREAYDAWREYMLKFGFGRTLGSDLKNELKGMVPTSDYYQRYVFGTARWRALPIISLSIGQGELGITPFQLANYCAMLANRGYYYIPHIVREIEGREIPEKFRVRQESGISRSYFEPVIEGMEQVMTAGTGARSAIPGIAVCGKTGTAQNPHGADHSVFMAFAPRENPRIAVSVYVENGIWGATYAAPISSLVIEKYLNDTISSQRLWLEESMLKANLMNPSMIPVNDGDEE